MQIRFGFELVYDCPKPTPMIMNLNVHYSRVSDLLRPDHLHTQPSVPVVGYRDGFGNWCSRLTAPAGEIRIATDAVIQDSGLLDAGRPRALEHFRWPTCPARPWSTCSAAATARPIGSRRSPGPCSRARPPAGLGCRPSAISCTGTSRFGYAARPRHQDRAGGLPGAHRRLPRLHPSGHRLCRCMNIPARYCTGYLGDIGVPPAPPMDFSAWMEVFLGGHWHVVDPRNRVPRIGRVLIAQGTGRGRRGAQQRLRPGRPSRASRSGRTRSRRGMSPPGPPVGPASSQPPGDEAARRRRAAGLRAGQSGRHGSAAVLVCDHASNRIPRVLGNLGLGPSNCARHIAWDPGAAAVARGLCARLDAPLVLGGVVAPRHRPQPPPWRVPSRSPRVSDDRAHPGQSGADHGGACPSRVGPVRPLPSRPGSAARRPRLEADRAAQHP
jgi:hypothetical protein